MVKPGPQLDTFDFVRLVKQADAESESAARVWVFDGTHKRVTGVYCDDDGDIVILTEGSEVDG